MDCQSTTGKAKRRGFSLIEAAIVLGLVGLVIGGIWTAAAAMMESHEFNKTVEGIFTIAGNVQRLVSIRDSENIPPGPSFTPMLISAGTIPKDWIKNNTIQSPYGGNVLIYNSSIGNGFAIRIYGVPKDSCAKLVVNISSSGAQAGSKGSGSYYGRSALGSISVGTSPATYFSNFPVSLSHAATACDAFVTGIMEFGFGYTRIN